MALDTRLANAQRSRAADAVTARLNNGYLRFYGGTRPATADTGLSGQSLHAEVRFNATAFDPAVNGVAVARALTADSAIDLGGTPTWARAFESDGVTPVLDLEVGTSGANINIASLPLTQNAELQVNSFTYTQPAQGA